ncbi:MAG: hypothetical protein DRP83_00665 [Planctomycetota bacterium]|nr:MAG: hypothetical protein DRP83_00665 [Planctomycetota bacterium]
MALIDKCSPNCPGWKSYPDGTLDDERYYTENLDDANPNEDFVCGWCGKDLPGRFMFCRAHCEDALMTHLEKSDDSAPDEESGDVEY